MNKLKIVNPLISAISLVIILTGSAVWWALGLRNAVLFNDKTFIISIVFACVGAVIAIASKSRRHYYLFLKKKFANNDIDPMEFEAAEEKRNTHTRFGLSVLLAGIVGIAICTVLVLV